MLKSMTGFGKAEEITPLGTFTVEIRAVNHRYCEISTRLPRSLYEFENEIKRMVASVLKRGKIDVSVQWNETASTSSMPQLDMSIAKGYYDIYTHLAKELNLPQDADPAFIMSQKGVLKEAIPFFDETELKPQLMIAVSKAIVAIDTMRICEGGALLVDLQQRRKQIFERSELIKERIPCVVTEYKQKLKIRLEQLLESIELDDARLAQEVALLADRSDITEELVRLASHFNQFDEALLATVPVGRKLDFLMQEMNREVNTIGSKSNDVEISNHVIEIKAEMEKMREQVQNIE